MAEMTKYAPIDGGTLISGLKSQFSILKTKKRTVALAYTFVFVFIAFTLFLAFTPSPNSYSPVFTNPFNVHTTNTTSASSPNYRSHFSSIFYYFYPRSTSPPHKFSPVHNAGSQNNGSVSKNEGVSEKGQALSPSEAAVLPKQPSFNQTLSSNSPPQKPLSGFIKGSSDVKNQTQNKQLDDKNGVLEQNQTQNKQLDDKNGVLEQNKTKPEDFHKVEVLKANQSAIGTTNSPAISNKTVNLPAKPAPEAKNVTASGDKKITKGGTNAAKVKQGIDDLIESLRSCDFFDGNWVRDESYPLYSPGSCSLIDEQFNCYLNGRPDHGYLKLKWKPKGCTLPRLDGGHMLEMLRGKRLVFVGDSLNRNMWESLICILKNSVKDQKKVYEQSGRQHFRSEASYSFVFEDYKCTVEFFVSPFLVREWEFVEKKGTKKETLRLDLVGETAHKYKGADIIVFNTGHWWTHPKTSNGKDYYQEGSHVYSELNVLEAFRRAITTWGRWLDANINPKKSLVFYRGYSSSHFSGGQWNSGGQCDHETEPIKNDTYLAPYPPMMDVFERVLRGVKTKVTYLNVTKMTDYRKDGHPSMYRKQHLTDKERRHPLNFQDCSHWCLPGVPDVWNEILYAELLVKLNQRQESQKRT